MAGCFFIIPSYAIEFPQYRGLNVKIDGTVSQIYTDNITFTKDDQEGAFLTTFGLGVNIEYQGKRRTAGFTGRMTRQISSSEFTNPSENISLRFTNDFSKYDRLSVTNTFTHTRVPENFTIFERFIDVEREDDVTDIFEQEFFRFRGRFDSYENRFDLTYTRDIMKELSVSTNYSNGQFWSPEGGITDSQHNNGGVRFNYHYSVATRFSLSYQLATGSFEDGRNITTHSISTGIRQNITKQLVIEGRIGAVNTPSGTETIIYVSMEQPIYLDARTSGELSFKHDVRIRTDRADTFRSWRFSGRLNRSILENLHGSISVFYGEGTFGSTGEKDTFLGANIRLVTILWEHESGKSLSGHLGYVFARFDSTEENRGHTRNTINMGVTLRI